MEIRDFCTTAISSSPFEDVSVTLCYQLLMNNSFKYSIPRHRQLSSYSCCIAIISKFSKVSSPFLEFFPLAPTPPSSSSSSAGTSQSNDSARRWATKRKIVSSRSEPNRRHSLSVDPSLISTGRNVNHSPKADQKLLSFARLLIL